MKWTTDQRSAIEERGHNLLLAAAAGSGKTTVLVERVATLLEEGADIREMLIVTFTRAAAADMRMSLIKRLNALAVDNPRFRQQAEYAEFASISTIHSFCTDLLRAFFQTAGVDPAFRIADGAEQNGGNVLHYATKEEAEESLKAELDANTVMLVKASHSMHFEALTDLLQKHYD